MIKTFKFRPDYLRTQLDYSLLFVTKYSVGILEYIKMKSFQEFSQNKK